MAYSIKALGRDYSWPYGERHHHQFVDNFHTGFNLVALYDWMESTGDYRWQEQLLGAYHLKFRFMSYTNNKKTVQMMGLPMHPWTMGETLDEISRRLDEGKVTQHVVVNVAKLVRLQNDSLLRDSVVACDIINADGMGIVWGARFLGVDIPVRVTGIDLFSNLLHLASERGDSVFLLGARPEVIEKTIKNIQEDCPKLQIAGWHHGYFWDNEKEVVDIIRYSGAKLLFVGISSPKKERFINKWCEQLGAKFVMGVRGTFDFMAV